jgi:hypothetical protein
MEAFWFLFAISFVCWILKHATLTVYPNAAESEASLPGKETSLLTKLACRSEEVIRIALLACENRDLN